MLSPYNIYLICINNAVCLSPGSRSVCRPFGSFCNGKFLFLEFGKYFDFSPNLKFGYEYSRRRVENVLFFNINSSYVLFIAQLKVVILFRQGIYTMSVHMKYLRCCSTM